MEVHWRYIFIEKVRQFKIIYEKCDKYLHISSKFFFLVVHVTV